MFLPALIPIRLAYHVPSDFHIMKKFLVTCVTALSAVNFLSTPAAGQGPQPGNDQGRAIAGKGASPRDPAAVPEGLAKSDWQSIRAAYEAGRHAFQPIEGGWQARNPGQQWTTKFDGRGFVAHPREGDWTWGLELKGYGFPGAERVIRGVPAVKAEGQRLTYEWDATIQEWFVNDARGLEHGFAVRERPAVSPSSPESPLSFALSTRGTLHPRISADAQGVFFVDSSGATVLNYTGLKVWDADGKVLASRFEKAGEHSVRLVVEEHGARYPLTIDPIAQQAYLKPAAVGTTQYLDGFGTSVAVSGDTVVVGANAEDSSTTGVNSTPNDTGGANFNSGAAYVFVRSAGVWTQQAYLKPAIVGTTQEGDEFGSSVAVSGDTVVVGANAEDSRTTGVNSTPNEDASGSGAAYVFVRSAGVWTQQAYLKPAAVGTSQASESFGSSVAVSGDTVVAGARFEASDTTGVNSTPNESGVAGAAYIFTGLGPSPDADGDGLLDSWELTYWPATAGHSALDDFDHDGYVELLELAFGLDPRTPNAGGLPPMAIEGGYLTMTITRQPGVTYEVQSAGSLQAGQPDSFSPASTTVLIDNATTLKVRDNTPHGTPPARFLRVEVTAAP